MAYAGIHIPAGCEVQIGDDEASLATVGVLPEDSDTTVGINYDSVEVKGSKNEDVQRYVKNMAASAKFTMYQILLDNIAKLAKGIMTVETIAGDPVSGQNQVITDGWENLRAYLLDGQNADGSVPTVAIAGLDEGDDYFLFKGADGKWYIYFDESGTHAPSGDITLTLGYTPAASKRARMGSASAVITAQVVRFIKVIGGKTFSITLWSASNTAGLTFAFPASSQDKPTSLDVELAGGLDTNRTDGNQLLEIIDEIGLGVAGVDY